MRKLVIACLLLLAACASPVIGSHKNDRGPATAVSAPASSGSNPVISGLNSVVLADLQAADQDAIIHGDVVASQCYEYLVKVKTQLDAEGGIAGVKGVVSGFQKLRDLDKLVTGANPAFAQACGPLAMDVQNAMLRGGAMAAGAMTIMPVISGLPAALGVATGASGLLLGGGLIH